jgi:hypothetical protein
MRFMHQPMMIFKEKPMLSHTQKFAEQALIELLANFALAN